MADPFHHDVVTMPLATFEELHELADRAARPREVVAAGGANATVMRALRTACDRGWVDPIVVGHEAEIRREAEQAGVALADFLLVDADEIARAAVAEVRADNARLLMKGRVSTPHLMRAVLDPERGLRGGRVVCQVVLIEILPHGRRFLMADTGICVHPDLKKKVEILQSAVEVAHAVGEPLPKVAMMAATESVVETMPETFDAAELGRRNAAGEFPGCVIQGPLSFDLAYAAEAADRKHIEGAVVGAADVMVFPTLAAANLTVKAIMYTAPCRFGGVLCGTSHPVVFMSRADSVETRLNSLALALRVAQWRDGQGKA